MRAERERARRLTLRHRWYAGGIATVLSGALVFAGLTPAVAETAPPEETTTVQETATPDDGAPGDAPDAGETSDGDAAADTSGDEGGAGEETSPREGEDASGDADSGASGDGSGGAGGDEGADEGDAEGDSRGEPEQSAPQQQAALAPQVLSAVADCVGGDTQCGDLTLQNVVVGGSATTANWALRATDVDSTDWYDFTSGQERRVPKPGEYSLSATPDGGVTDDYATELTCTLNDTSGSNRLAFDDPILSYIYSGSGSNNLEAVCTFTHTVLAPSTVVVTKGDLRTGLGATDVAATYAEGARFALYDSNTSTTELYTCTTAASGDCTFTGVTEVGVQLWIGEIAPQPATPAAANYSAPIDQLTTGDDPFTDRPYRYPTPELTGTGETYAVPSESDFPGGNTQWGATSGYWANRLNNPALNLTCTAGVEVGLVMDLSGSVAPYRDDLRDAAKAFVASLLGTGSSVALFSFGNASPRAGTSNYATPVLVDAAGQATLDTRIDNYWTNTVSGQGTNWDAGLYAAAQGAASQMYDIVFVLTDGNPTYSGSGPSGNGSRTTFRELERSVFSANAIKNAGTRVVSVGIGGNLSADNLASISGTNGYAPGDSLNDIDYTTAGWDQLTQLLEDFALGLNCQSDITVTKLTQDGNAQPQPAADWTFTTTADAGTLSAPATQQTGADGSASWMLTFDQQNATASVTITETTQPGWSLASAVCNEQTMTITDDAVTITGVGTGQNVDCTFTNVRAFDDLTVTKTADASYDRAYTWSIDKSVDESSATVVPGDDATFDYDIVVTPSAPVDSNFAVAGDITITNPNDVAVPVTIADSVGIDGASCTIDGGANQVVPADDELVVGYECDLPSATDGTNTATVMYDLEGTQNQASGTDGFTFGAPANTTDGSVVVADTFPEFAQTYPTVAARTVDAVDGPTTFEYSADRGADVAAGECGEYTNTASINPSTGEQTSSQTVEVCAGADLAVSKNIVATLTRTYDWSLTKDVDATTKVVGQDGTATFDYTVTVTPGDYTDSAWAMDGQITVTNPNSWPVTADVTDAQDFGENLQCTVTDGDDAVIPAAENDTDGSATFDYECTFTGQPTYSGTNTATVTWDAAAAHTPTGSAQGTASITEDDWDKTLVNEVVNVVDDQTDPDNPVSLGTATWNAEGTPEEFEYSLTLDGPDAPGSCVDYTNVAVIEQLPSKTDSVTVTVCDYADLTVDKTASTSFDRSYAFELDKSGPTEVLVVDPESGEATASYEVTITDGAATDSDFIVAGAITVTNPNDVAVALTSLTDTIDGCDLALPGDLTVPANDVLVVDYSCEIDGATPTTQGENTATATWSTDGLPGSAGSASDTVPYSFANATITDLNDKTVTVVDDKTDQNPPVELGTHTWTAPGAEQDFAYALQLDGVAGECEMYTNTATIVETQQTASHTVTVCDYADLVVAKTADPAFDRDYDWSIDKTVDPATATVIPGENATFTYMIPVTPSAPQDSGFAVTGVITVSNSNSVPVTLTGVTDAVTLDGDDPEACTTTPPSLVVPAGGILQIPYSCDLPDASATATGTNTATVTWDAAVLPGTTGTASTAPTAFDFASATPTVTDGSVTVTDTAPEFAVAYPGDAAIATAPEGKTFTYTRDLGDQVQPGTCYVFPNTATIAATTDQAAQQASADARVCVPAGSVDKSVVSVEQGADETWTIVYDVIVTNTSTDGVAFVYTLEDTLDFGAGITATGASATVPAGVTPTAGWNGVSQTEVAADATLAATDGGDATHTYRVTATATADGSASGAQLACTEGEPGAFRNVAEIFLPAQTTPYDDAEACAEPAAPTVTKTPLTSEQNTDTGEWTIGYEVTVANTTGLTLAYTLTDTPDALPTGVTGGIWQATGPAITGGGSGTLNGAWDGDGVTELATGLIPDGALHTYTVTRTVQVAASVTDEMLDCEAQTEGSGLWNTATVSNGVGGNSDDACAVIDRPGVTITKTETGTSQAADGTWQITYDVVVANASSDLAAVYTLDDTLAFGGDIVIVDASWTGPTSGNLAGPDWTATLAADRLLAPDGEETYTVTAHATVPASAFAGDTLMCQEGEEPSAGGFLNRATVTANGEDASAHDCSEPALPTIQKQGVSASQDPEDPSQWAVSYELTVESGGYDTVYSLSDTPQFAPGITVLGGVAQRTDTADGVPIDIEPGVDFVTDVPLAADAVGENAHVYTVVWTVDISDTFDPDLGQCQGEGTGFFNVATLTTGEIPVNAEDCIPVDERVYPTPTKTVVSTTQDPDTGEWIIEYDLTVTLPAEGPENPKGLSAEYDLTDELQFGGDIEIVQATWSGQGTTDEPFAADGTAVLATDAAIGAGETHTYTVVVVAEVTAAAIEAGTIACYPDAEDPSGGFLNAAELSSGGQQTEVDACSEPAFPEIDKVGGTTVDNGDGSWDISYLVTVSYSEGVDPLPDTVTYDLTDVPALPAGVELQGEWAAAAADGDTPTPTNPTWNGEGTWLVVDGGALTPENGAHTYELSATVEVTEAPAGPPEVCEDTDATGILIVNVGTVTSGDYVADDDGCQVVHFDDVSIEKTSALPEGQEWVEPGDVFDYVLTVTNHGTRAATNVQVTDDDLNERLEILGLTVDPGALIWGPAPGYTGNDVDLTIDELPVGGEAVITVTVELLEGDGAQNIGFVEPGGEVPTPATPLDELTNTACVSADVDSVASNDCDDHEIPVHEITAVVWTTCQSDAGVLGWSVTKSAAMVDEPIDLSWVPENALPTTDPASVEITEPGGAANWTQTEVWPGSAFTPAGIAIDYPGWRAIEITDVVPGSVPLQYYLPGTDQVMTPEQQAQYVFNGLIVDPSEIDFAWRGDSTVTFTVNPSLMFTVAYPEPTAECFTARHTEVQIEKTASVDNTAPGSSFVYTLDVANVSEDAAAENVVVTDEIPADIRITDVQWTGEGDVTAFPNWQTCEVSGASAAGYGGTLECVLFGVLQPVDAGHGPSSAPTITLAAQVSPDAASRAITNVAVVDYATFGDPTDTGRDSDDATIRVAALPVTGGQLAIPLVVFAAIALLGGAGMLLIARRRRGEPAASL